MNKAFNKYGVRWKHQIYIWLVYLKVTGRMKPSWKTLFRNIIQENFPNRVGQCSNSGKKENTTKIFLMKSNPKTHNRQNHQGWNEGENSKGSQRERSGHPQREAHQTHSKSLGRNPTRQERVGAKIQHPWRKELSTQNFISSQTELHKLRKNKILCE